MCDCRDRPRDHVDRALDEGASRVVLRGAAAGHPRLAEIVRRARAGGAARVVVRTHALAHMHPDAARALAGMGVDGALVPLFSSASAVHDRIAQRPAALAHALVGMRSLAAAGVQIEIEIPLLAPRLQDLRALVELAHRAVPSLRAVRFFVSPERVPAVLSPPSWDEAGPGLAAAIRRCRELGIEARLAGSDGVPLCALRDAPDLHDAHRFDPRRRTKPAGRDAHGAACTGCAVRAQCAGATESYRRAHGERGLTPFAKKPAAMYAQRTPGSPVFTVEHRRLAAKVGVLVLRPTVNCNQDCTFCSANETSSNVWTEPRAMMRALVRAAQRGVRRVSFGGGEPTLSKDLVHYVRAASRLGVPDVELVTNAVLLDRAERVQALRDAGLTHAFVSLHAHDERLSQMLTRKVGDHARTMRGIDHLRAAGVATVVNHVVTSRNFPYLTAFVERVREAFDGEVMISFAFVTPQYKALEDMTQVPQLTEVMPHLRRAVHRALELGQPVQIGSRQGIPPCVLGELRPWSDVLSFGAEPASEDAPQKQRAPGCDECRYARQCTGLWRAYVARYGLSELRPIPGGPFDDRELQQIRSRPLPAPWDVPMSFDDAHPLLRDRDAEDAGRRWYASGAVVAPPPIRALPVVGADRSRPLRVLLVGSGRQARRLVRAASALVGISIEAVASPHAPEAELPELGGCPRFRSMEEAIEEMRPEAVIVAAATHAHRALARAALENGLPVLVEKPLARTEEDAADLVRAAADARAPARLVPAHNMLFAAGMDALFGVDRLPTIAFARRVTASGPEAMRTWSRSALFEVMHHALSVVGHAAGGGVPRLAGAVHHGEAAPERIRLQLVYARAEAEVDLDFRASADETRLTRAERAGVAPAMTWHRAGAKSTLQADGVEVPIARDGSDLTRMLAHFRDVALGRTEPLLSAADALDVLRATRAAIAALEEAGAPFDRSDAPRHVASPELRAFPRASGRSDQR